MRDDHETAAPSETLFDVVRNDEGHFSISRSDRRPPTGWSQEAFCGRREECLDYIDRVWADPRLTRIAGDTDITGIID